MLRDGAGVALCPGDTGEGGEAMNKILMPLAEQGRVETLVPYLENVACTGRNKGSDQAILPSVEPIVESGAIAKLFWIIGRLSRLVRGKRRRALDERYISHKSRDEESRLEFQRFLYW